MIVKTILITRPKGDEAALAERLQALGLRVIHAPMTEIYLRHSERVAVAQAVAEEPDAVILTSRHGAQALALLTDIRDMCLLCVGEATADVARSLGFTRCEAARGNVASLIETIEGGYDAGSRFLYISGQHTSHDLEQVLAVAGMEIKRIVAYEALAVRSLSDTLVEQIKRGQIDAATFLSPRAARSFTALIARHRLEEALADMQAFCLSEPIAAQLSGWAQRHVAHATTLASLVACVDNAA